MCESFGGSWAVTAYVPPGTPDSACVVAVALDTASRDLEYLVESAGNSDNITGTYGADYYWLFNNQRIAAFVASAMYRNGAIVCMQNYALFLANDSVGI